MGIRIHKAIGWGIGRGHFNAICTHPDKNDEEFIYDLWSHDKNNGPLIVPKEERSRVWNLRDGTPPYFEALPYERDEEDNPIERPLIHENESFNDLFVNVFGPDSGLDDGYLVFFPSSRYKKKWYRYSDDIDWAMSRWPKGTKDLDDEPDLDDDVKFVAYGHYPWSTYLMNRDGTPAKWPEALALQNHPELMAAVPSEIRFYMKHFNLLDDDGVNALRPIVATWWA